MDNKKIKFPALSLFLFFASFYSLFCIGHFGGDGYEDYLTAESIVLDGNLSLYDRPSDIDELNYIKKNGREGADGMVYSPRQGLGLPVILSFFYLLGHVMANIFKGVPHDFITMFFVSFANPLISALSCLLVFIIARHLYFSLRTGVLLSLIYGLATMVPVYTRTGFSDPALVLFILLGIYFILKYRDLRKVKYAVFSALAISYGIFIKPAGLIFLPCFVIYILSLLPGENKALLRKGIKDLGIFMLFILVPFILIGIYNYYIYGGFLKFGGKEASEIGKRIIESRHFLKGLYYYLFSTGKGFFIFNPVLILSFFALYKLPRERRKETVLFLLIFAVNLLFYVKSFRRGSLFSWGPRYLLPSVAALTFLVGDFYESYKKFIPRLLLFVLSLAGFLIMLPCMFVNQSKFYFFVVNELRLEEYMINFIPDLSPILGAWKILISNLTANLRHLAMPFVYNPDYRLLPPVSAMMDKYNQFDFWFLKIFYYTPQYIPIVYLLLSFLILFCLIAFFILIKSSFYSQGASRAK